MQNLRSNAAHFAEQASAMAAPMEDDLSGFGFDDIAPPKFSDRNMPPMGQSQTAGGLPPQHPASSAPHGVHGGHDGSTFGFVAPAAGLVGSHSSSVGRGAAQQHSQYQHAPQQHAPQQQYQQQAHFQQGMMQQQMHGVKPQQGVYRAHAPGGGNRACVENG